MSDAVARVTRAIDWASGMICHASPVLGVVSCARAGEASAAAINRECANCGNCEGTDARGGRRGRTSQHHVAIMSVQFRLPRRDGISPTSFLARYLSLHASARPPRPGSDQAAERRLPRQPRAARERSSPRSTSSTRGRWCSVWPRARSPDTSSRAACATTRSPPERSPRDLDAVYRAAPSHRHGRST